MARQFNGTSQALQSASALALSAYNTVTICWWMWWNGFANDDQLAMEYSANYNSFPDTFLVDPNAASGFWESNVVGEDSAHSSTYRIARPTAAAWHHYGLRMDFTQDGFGKIPAFYIDGASVTVTNILSGFTATNQNFSNQILNVMSRNGAALWAAGRCCELAIWSSVTSPSAANIADMFNGGASGNGKSAAFYPTNLRYYWKIDGTTSPEPENSGGIALTLIGAPTQVTGPPIDYPTGATGWGGLLAEQANRLIGEVP
jgi:hypothetical protein